jgi:hypothetical protein
LFHIASFTTRFTEDTEEHRVRLTIEDGTVIGAS